MYIHMHTYMCICMYIYMHIYVYVYVYDLLNDPTVLFLTIQFSVSHLFSHNLNVKYFYMIHRWDLIRY